MIKHIVLWNFADEAAGSSKAANLAKGQADLVALENLFNALEAFIGAKNDRVQQIELPEGDA